MARSDGLQGRLVEIESDIGRGLPGTKLIGLPDAGVREAKDRVRSAVRNTGYRWPDSHLTVGLSPAHLPKIGSGYDLGIAVSVMAASNRVPVEKLLDTVVLGELALDGRVRAVRGVLPALIAARDEGMKRVVIPAGCLVEGSHVDGIDVWGADSLGAVLAWPRNDERLIAPPEYLHPEIVPPALPDLADVVGQPEACWALQVAATGGHHLLLKGPRGVGKTMLAHRLPALLPRLSDEEALEVAAVNSVDGTLPPESPHAARGWCARHYTRWRKYGTTEAPSMREVHACSVEHCDGEPSARGLCNLHYQRWRARGTTDPPQRRPPTCTVDGCGNKHAARDLCSSHLRRLRVHGSLDLPVRVPRTCEVAGCGKPSASSGLCSMHYKRWRKHGNVLREPVRRPDTCTVEGCDREHEARDCAACTTRAGASAVPPIRRHRSHRSARSMGAPNRPSGGGLCRMHYGRVRADRQPGPALPRRAPNGQRRPCIVDNCGQPSEARDRCKRHYSEWRRKSDPCERHARTPAPTHCRRFGCTNKPNARGLCRQHYAGWRRGDVPLNLPNDDSAAPDVPLRITEPLPHPVARPEPKLRPACREPGCERGVAAKGYCNPHYQRWHRQRGGRASPARV